MPRDLTGQKFGLLTAVSASYRKRNRTYCKCVCDCGSKSEVLEHNLIRGNSRSCGCENKKRFTHKTHGLSRISPEYQTWKGMRQRCLNPNNAAYADYGGRGIAICQRWLDSFVQFKEDMGSRPSSAHSLDRKNNDGPYAPDNCQWATKSEQARNRSSSLYVEHAGCIKSVCQWADDTGLPRDVIYDRLFTYGWTVERALTTPLRK